MTDKELIARLHLPWPKDGGGDEVTLPLWVLELTAEAADRIKELEVELSNVKLELNGAVKLLTVAGDGLRLMVRVEMAEAKLAKAVEALEGVREFVRDLCKYADQGHTLVPALRKACATLAELKGQDDEL